MRSVLKGKIPAFGGGFDYAFTTKHDVVQIMGRKIPLRVFTDSKSLLEVFTKCSSST